jgi:hypothetical protein
MAQRSEDGVGKTREMTKRLERAISGWIRPAISIQASSRDDGCINRPDTRKHLNLRSQIFQSAPLNPTGRPHTAIYCCRLATIDEWPLFGSAAKRPDLGVERTSAHRLRAIPIRFWQSELFSEPFLELPRKLPRRRKRLMTPFPNGAKPLIYKRNMVDALGLEPRTR